MLKLLTNNVKHCIIFRKNYMVYMEFIGYKRKGNKMRKHFGFTLAEVLITLGIIGVVAAMTIPTLISNTNSQKFRSQFKKTISTLNQAGLMAQAQYDIDYGMVELSCGKGSADDEDGDPSTDSPTGANPKITFCAILNGTLTGQTFKKDSPYNTDPTFKALAAGEGDDSTAYYYYTLADGSMVAFPQNQDTASGKPCTLELGAVIDEDWIDDHSNCLGFIDVNGTTLPNKEVTCSEAAASDDDDSDTTVTDGSAALTPETPCVVKNDAHHVTDIYPIVFHDATVEPASNAAKYVLSSAK